MFEKISSKLKYPAWVAKCPRYRTLDLFDKMLDGQFYSHLASAFYDETDPQGRTILLDERRPSAQFRFATQVATYCARKLFAGNHAPRVVHDDPAARKTILKLLRKAKFLPKMIEAAKLGSVGSVAVTFRIDGEGDDMHIGLHVWRAKYCEPSFDGAGNLTALRLQYVTTGAALAALGAPDPRPSEKLDRGRRYWLVRDYLPDQEITYAPIQEADWNPVDHFLDDGRTFGAWETIDHKLGFVPGWWFTNLVGGAAPDGACTFEPGVQNSIEIDYTLSQIGRGVRYNAAPQPVIKGDIVNGPSDGSITRGAASYIHLKGDYKDEEGGSWSGADAKLLEMSGAGTEAALKLVDKLRDIALEAVAAARKDPSTMKGPMSGRAMEFIDQEFYDLIMELRTQYGEFGALELARRIVQAVDPSIDLSSFTFRWPRLFQPTPTDLAQVIPALAIAIDPLKAGPAMPAVPGATGADGQTKPGTPATTGPDPKFMLLTVEEARSWLLLQMDMNLPNDDDEDPEEPHEDTRGAAPEHTPEPVDISEPAPNLDGGIPRPTDVNVDA
ncbi:MAG TPA: hypothetical protein VL614_15020 [Acetobacteraceae bacterium]|nr:hypothetical protein [Acetobacteraceae bacterium]